MARSTLKGSRVLFLDDSGNPAVRDSSTAVVIGGFSIETASVQVFSRRVVGAKGRFFPPHGHPAEWEVKASRTITPNPWKRHKNREFLAEVVRILGQLDCTVYTASIDKTRMHHRMGLKTTMPLLLQALVEHFSVECAQHKEAGLSSQTRIWRVFRVLPGQRGFGGGVFPLHGRCGGLVVGLGDGGFVPGAGVCSDGGEGSGL